MVFEVPILKYDYNSLEPFIDEETMMIHHDKHHKAYVDKLNEAISKYPETESKEVVELLNDLNSIPEDIRIVVRNHGGGHFNHSLFWEILGKDTELAGKIKGQIEKDFGSFDEFKKKFIEAGLTQFGSGWAWLVVNKSGKLEIVKTANQDNPISQGLQPILGVDVWEHAYYLKYQNKRADYLEAFFSVINWEKVEKNYEEVIKRFK